MKKLFISFLFHHSIYYLISAMNIAANQPIYPPAAPHLSYHNGAIIQSPMQQTASLVRKIFISFLEK